VSGSIILSKTFSSFIRRSVHSVKKSFVRDQPAEKPSTNTRPVSGAGNLMASKQYFVGHPGTGKSGRLADHLVTLINAGVRPDRILLLAPQQAQAERYRAAQSRVQSRTRGEPFVSTIYSLAQQHVTMFFPRIAPRAGFANPKREAVFIDVELAQYFLDQIAAPHLAEFEDLKLSRPRLISQLLDSMNKASTANFPLNELAERLNASWNGPEPRAHHYRRVQDIALAFRRFCLQHNLIDFSLSMNVFGEHLLDADFYQEFIQARYRHILADNIEEMPPVAHLFISQVMRTCDTAVLAEDDPGSYRLFLGADRHSARELREWCDTVTELPDPRLAPDAAPTPAKFGAALMTAIQTNNRPRTLGAGVLDPVHLMQGDRYWTQMVQGIVERIREQVQAGVKPKDIAVLAPIVEDVLRFELQERLRPDGIDVRTVRPSRPLFDHPIARMMSVWARLANPQWGLPATAQELARALSMSIAGLDIVRAQLLADAAHKLDAKTLPALDDKTLWERVGVEFQPLYARLQQWMAARTGEGEANRADGEAQSAIDNPKSKIENPIDLFWQQLFTGVLSQEGYALMGDVDGAVIVDRLVRSARNFRQAFEMAGVTAQAETVAVAVTPAGLQAPVQPSHSDIGLAYINNLAQGLLAAQYAPERMPVVAGDDAANDGEGAVNAVLLTPAYAYLTSDFRSRVQFWLDISATRWHDRLYQPLTHPYVLSRNWQKGRLWTDDDELAANRDMLARVVGGLAFRCSDEIVLASSQMDVSGMEESGMLNRAIQRVWLSRQGNGAPLPIGEG
jgi:hypothetical protein